MKLRIFILTLMMGWDFSLHLVRLLGVENSYPLWITFPFYTIPYELFWTVFWGLATLLGITLIFSKTHSTKIINKIYVPETKEVSS